MEQEFLSHPDSALLNVDNPVIEPFQVRLRFSAPIVRSEYASASKIMVVADIEGNFAGFYSLLVAQKVIDARGNWIYGDGHLVMLGDLFDRGPDVTPIFWLLYKLEIEARETGGFVHTLLGNHEIMNFNSDLRYLHNKYKAQAEQTGFTYPGLYSMETVLGRWLRNKSAVIKIGNILFSHGGISPEVMAYDLSLQEINAIVLANNIGTEINSTPSEIESIFGPNGIFWYRGWIDEAIANVALDTLLIKYNADHMVIGHTIVHNIQASHNYKLIAVDLYQPMKNNTRPFRALLFENGSFYEVDNEGAREPITSN